MHGDVLGEPRRIGRHVAAAARAASPPDSSAGSSDGVAEIGRRACSPSRSASPPARRSRRPPCSRGTSASTRLRPRARSAPRSRASPPRPSARRCSRREEHVRQILRRHAHVERAVRQRAERGGVRVERDDLRRSPAPRRRARASLTTIVHRLSASCCASRAAGASTESGMYAAPALRMPSNADDRVRRPVEQQPDGRLSRRAERLQVARELIRRAHRARRRSAAACPPRCRPPSHSAAGRRRPADRAHAPPAPRTARRASPARPRPRPSRSTPRAPRARATRGSDDLPDAHALVRHRGLEHAAQMTEEPLGVAGVNRSVRYASVSASPSARSAANRVRSNFVAPASTPNAVPRTSPSTSVVACASCIVSTTSNGAALRTRPSASRSSRASRSSGTS